jgi:amyloid beta precursor protein binding protein 1
VHAPFPALIEYANSFDFASMNSQQHGHIPAVVILVQALQAWRAAHDGKGPATTAERKEFVQSVTALKRSSDEENFDEAVTLFRRAGTKTGVPAEIDALFKDPACDNVSASSSNFWLLLRAVRDFVSHPDNPSGLLPLSGALPDMKAETTGYVDLQNLFKTQAKKDVALVSELLGELLDKIGRPRETITQEEVETFVKHSAFLKVVRGRSLRQELEASALKGKIGKPGWTSLGLLRIGG